MTNEDLDAARGREAERIWGDLPAMTGQTLATIAARLTREGWTPPEPVDPDLLAARERMKTHLTWIDADQIDQGAHDSAGSARAYLAGCTRGREGATDLVEAAEALIVRWDGPLWKDAPHTAYYIDGLRKAIASAKRGG